MAHTIQLVLDGHTTVELNSGNIRCDGFRWISDTTAELDLLIKDTTSALVQFWYNLIEARMEQAKDRQDNPKVEPVYLTVQWAGESTAWRSEIVEGEMLLVDDSLFYLIVNTMRCRLLVTHQNYWEAATETELALKNEGTPSALTGGITIYNHDDTGSQSNYVDVLEQYLLGVLPAACRIVLRNSTASSISYNNIYIGHMMSPAVTNFSHMLEGEDNTIAGGSIQPAVSDTSLYSDGFYYERTWTGALSSSVLYSIPITGTEIEYADGGHFRLLARLAATPNTTCYVKAGLYYQTVYKIMETPEVRMTGNRLQDLGELQLLPSMSGISNLGDMVLKLTVRDSATGSLSIDFIQMTPVDGWRHLKTLGGTFANGTEFIDDGMADHLYTFESGTDAYPNLVAKGKRIMLRPGNAHRIYFLFDEATGMTIGRTSVVQMYYRPRRRKI